MSRSDASPVLPAGPVDLAPLLKAIQTSLLRMINDRMRPTGLTYAQCTPLAFLQGHDASSVSDIAVGTGCDPGHLTRILARLEGRGLCMRERSNADRRVVKVRLLPAGGLIADQLQTVMAAALHDHLRGFSTQELLGLNTALLRMLANG